MFACVQGHVMTDDFYELDKGGSDNFDGPDTIVDVDFYKNDRRVNDDIYGFRRGLNDDVYENDRRLNEEIYDYIYGLVRRLDDADSYEVGKEVKRTQGEPKEFATRYESTCDDEKLSKICPKHYNCKCGCKDNDVGLRFTRYCSLCNCKKSKAIGNGVYSICQKHSCAVPPRKCKTLKKDDNSCCVKCADPVAPPPPPSLNFLPGFEFPVSPHVTGSAGEGPNSFSDQHIPEIRNDEDEGEDEDEDEDDGEK